MIHGISKSLLTIGVVATIAGAAATAAYFSAQAVSQTNTVTTGTLNVTLNTNNDGTLTVINMYPGAFVENSAAIRNTGSIRMNPSLSLTDANDPDGIAGKLWLQVWTNGKLWYNDWLTNAPGYSSNKITLDTIDPGNSVFVASRLILDESATTGGTYTTKVAITGYQWNDPAGATTGSVSDGSYVANDWSLNVCGVRPSSPWYVNNESTWQTQVANPSTGTQGDGSCIVP